ncbi:MAG TPA: methyltransferase domain-containing protein [Acidimicrobiales bacterium]|jgi:SAM-dependent methyltransferase|nr:methyltransferase domain-containing protein [Acidimicrobiales bacterium]
MTFLRSFYQGLPPSGQPGAGRVAAVIRLLDAETRARPVARILDLGCGDAALTALVAARVPQATVVAVDWSSPCATAARGRGLPAVVAGVDERGLPFPAASFDIVLMNEVIEHLVDPDFALDEAHRVLGPDGCLLLSTPNLAAWFNRLLLLAGVQPVFSEVSRLGIFGRPGHVVVGHLRLFTARALVEDLQAHGFRPVMVTGAPYHDVPRIVQGLDRLIARWPAAAAILVVRAAVGGPGGSPADPAGRRRRRRPRSDSPGCPGAGAGGAAGSGRRRPPPRR